MVYCYVIKYLLDIWMKLHLALHCCIAVLNEFRQPFTPLIKASMSRETTHNKILFLRLTFTAQALAQQLTMELWLMEPGNV